MGRPPATPYSIADVPVRRMAFSAGASLVLVVLIVLGGAAQGYVELAMRRGITMSFWLEVRWPLIWWLGWVALTPFVVELAWRLDLGKGRRAWAAAILAVGCVASYALHVAWQLAAMGLPTYRMQHPSWSEAFEFHTVTSLYLNVFVFWTIAGVATGFRLYITAQRRAVNAARLEQELTAAQLEVLRARLHPHFVSNALNGIGALMHRDPGTAETMITKLGNLLRRALERSASHEVTLKEEAELMTEYLDLERMRFGDDLRVEISLQPGLDQAIVPSFVYQPLIENALKHGIAAHGNAGCIRISARADRDRIVLTVADDGPGLDAASGTTSGVGLSNLQERLRALYGDDFTLELVDVEPSGLEVVITLPLRLA